jgi:ATP-dependent RNA helicase DDX49/DBP8
MARDDSDSSASDEDILHHQAGSRKRRRLSPNAEPEIEQGAESDTEPAQTRIPVSTISRIKAKHQAPTAASPVPAALPPSKEKLSFASIDVAPWLVASLASMEIKKPTGIQAACIPEILKGRDCIGGSRTGTGKTVAFSVPILQKWAEDPVGIFGLIVT